MAGPAQQCFVCQLFSLFPIKNLCGAHHTPPPQPSAAYLLVHFSYAHPPTPMLHPCASLRPLCTTANILDMVDFFETESAYLMVFEKLDGGELLEHIHARHR
jgi:serine/threonine protein kinase